MYKHLMGGNDNEGARLFPVLTGPVTTDRN